MNSTELIQLLSGSFYQDFANQLASMIQTEEEIQILYELITTTPTHIPKSVLNKIHFRGAYVLERIYFNSPSLFLNIEALFWEDYCKCENPSTRRHFAKIMAHLLRCKYPSSSQMEAIAESSIEWLLDKKTKVAVKVWCLEILTTLRNKIDWISESWNDIIHTLHHNASPAIMCRLRKI